MSEDGASRRALVSGAGDGASRRALLGRAGAALAGSCALALAGCGQAATAHKLTKELPEPLIHRDLQILGQALELERRTVAAYVAGIPLLPRPDAKTAEQFLSEELEHTGELISLITSAGGKPAPRANSYDLGHPQDPAAVLALLHTLEAMQIANYLRTLPSLSPGPVRAAVASILTVDSQHISMLRLAQGNVAVPGPFVTGSE